MVVAVDGPSGSGKSSVSKAFAKKHNFEYIDTGQMYRALTHYFLNNHIKDEDEIIEHLSSIDMHLEKGVLFLNGQALIRELRTPEIDKNVSYYSSIKNLRKWLVEFQRSLVENGDYIMDGRDIATVVLPNADVKIFLTADVTERAKRRAKEQHLSVDEVKADIQKRDTYDSTRKESPLKKAEDAIEIDTTNLTLEEVVIEMEEKIFG